MHKSILINTLIISLLSYAYGASSNSCTDKINCDSCMGTAHCTWCKEISFKNLRCNTVQDHQKNKCPPNDIVKPNPAKVNIKRNEQISKTMRITPQEIDVELAVGQESRPISLTYNDSTDKPLDLYYIMDLSATMRDDKETVSNQARELALTLQRITRDVRLGFGAFVDKPVLPFVAASQLREDPEFAIPYGFTNWLKLTNNWEKFSSIVRDAKISRNLDEPEGTLDALMQAITCTNEIGWRNTSRKLIVVATDGPFHIAGDGKLGGIVRPNDMKCHMENGKYTHSTLIDYPSIGEINAVILEQKVYVIFAVSQEQSNHHVIHVYNELQKHITQSTTATLSKDSSNVVSIIKNKYEEISSRVTLTIEDKPDYVDVKILAKCSPEGKYVPQMHCTDVGVKSPRIDFQITLTLQKCPDPRNKRNNEKDRVVISFFELTAMEKLIINLSYACTCTSCKQEIINEPKYLLEYCTGPQATTHISCGTCNCQEGRYGSKCECSVTGENEQATNKKCVPPQSNGTCSNRGECKCGRCDCIEGFNGVYCEDRTSGCQDQNGPKSLCSGPGQGKCVKGKCQCRDGYSGTFCECQDSKKELCIEPGQSLTSPACNGHGTCDCRQVQCKCDSGYIGPYCGICKSNCPTNEMSGSRCQDEFIRKCVRCNVQRLLSPDKKLDQRCNECNQKMYKGKTSSASNRADISTIEFEERRTLASLSEEVGTECRDLKINATPCYSVFKYTYRKAPQANDNDILQVFYTADGLRCEKEPPFLWYIFGVILGVLLAGILGLLIWKLATHLHDTREYRRFEKETKYARFGGGENPLYEKPMAEFQNPAYRE